MQRKPSEMHPQLCGIKHTLTCPPKWHSSYGTASLPQPARHIGQDRNPSQTSWCSTPNSETQMGPSFQRPRPCCSNGLHGLAGPKGSNPRRSNHTSPICSQLTLTQACHSQHASRQCFSESLGASKDTWASANATPSCPSCMKCSCTSWHLQPIQPC